MMRSTEPDKSNCIVKQFKYCLYFDHRIYFVTVWNSFKHSHRFVTRFPCGMIYHLWFYKWFDQLDSQGNRFGLPVPYLDHPLWDMAINDQVIEQKWQYLQDPPPPPRGVLPFTLAVEIPHISQMDMCIPFRVSNFWWQTELWIERV